MVAFLEPGKKKGKEFEGCGKDEKKLRHESKQSSNPIFLLTKKKLEYGCADLEISRAAYYKKVTS